MAEPTYDELPGRDLFPGRLEKALRDIVRTDERFYVKLKGANAEGLVCTNQRVFIIKGGILTGQLFGTNLFQLTYDKIAGVEVKFGMLTGYFEVSAAGMQNVRKSIWSLHNDTRPEYAPNCVTLNSRSQAQRFRDACAFILSRQSGPQMEAERQAPAESPAAANDIYGMLERLGQLRTSGVITEDEFQEKKRELLARI